MSSLNGVLSIDSKIVIHTWGTSCLGLLLLEAQFNLPSSFIGGRLNFLSCLAFDP